MESCDAFCSYQKQLDGFRWPSLQSVKRTLLYGSAWTHQTCNISRVDTHCKHQLLCTECPFTGDDVYRRFIFNLLSPIFNGERWIYEIDINNKRKSLTGCAVFVLHKCRVHSFVVFLLRLKKKLLCTTNSCFCSKMSL